MTARPVFPLALTLMAILLCPAQDSLLPVATTDLHLNLDPAQHRVRGFSASSDRATVFLFAQSSGSGPAAEPQLLTVLKSTGQQQPVPLPDFRNTVVQSGRDWLFQFTPGNITTTGRLTNVRTGESSVFPVITGVAAAAFNPGGTRLALLGSDRAGAPTSSRIAVYDCQSRNLIGTVTHPTSPGAATISFAAPDRLLFIETADLRITPIKVEATLSMGEPVQLSGAEADDSVQRASRNRITGTLRHQLILAHLPGANGGELFFLGPFKAAEGFRLAEFDASGRQIRSFRVHTENGADLRKVFGGPLLPVWLSTTSFELLGQDGVIRTYRIPSAAGERSTITQ